MNKHPTLKKYLNLGCGSCFSKSPEWINLDIFPHDSLAVIQYQLLLGIPFFDDSFEAVYHSHLLEHIPREQCLPFLRECLRVLKPGGILRIAVPDLEGIIRAYIKELDNVRSGDSCAKDRLLWMQIELLDQLVRTVSGGLMATAWRNASPELIKFIKKRIGNELDSIDRFPQAAPLRLPEKTLSLASLPNEPLTNGERHCWMYDTVSLEILLTDAGFTNIRITDYKTEKLGGFQPDCLADGSPRKPDSCYLEATKPVNPISNSKLNKIVLFSTYDRGGAGTAAVRLHQGLRKQQVSSVTYVQSKKSHINQVYVLPPTIKDSVETDGQHHAQLSSALKNEESQSRALSRWPHRPKGCEYFSTSLAHVRLKDIPLLSEAPILHFHWIARFIDIPANVEFLENKKIIWTLHDMNPFTGGCHYADTCEGYKKNCGSCPQLGSTKDNDLSRMTWKRKEYAYKRLNIQIVTPSEWLAKKVKASSLMERFPVECIANGIPLDIFKPYSKLEARKILCLEEESKVLLFCADGLLNRRKGLSYLIEALKLLQQYHNLPKISLLLVGHGTIDLPSLQFSVNFLGSLSNEYAIATAYSAADVVILPSLEDNLPNILTESLACGTPAVTFNVGGIPEIIDHGATGYLAQPQDTEDLARGLMWALNTQPTCSRLCRAKAVEKYSLDLCAQRYLSLYQKI